MHKRGAAQSPDPDPKPSLPNRFLRAKRHTRHWHQNTARVVLLLEELLRAGEYDSVSDLAKALQVPHTTCYRMVQTLEALGWVLVDQQGIVVSPRIFAQMDRFQPWRTLNVHSTPHLESLSQATGLHAKLTLWDNDQLVCISHARHAAMPTNNLSQTGKFGRFFAGSTPPAMLCRYTQRDLNAIMHKWDIHGPNKDAFLANWQHAREHGWVISKNVGSWDSIALALLLNINGHPLVLTAFGPYGSLPPTEELQTACQHHGEAIVTASLAAGVGRRP